MNTRTVIYSAGMPLLPADLGPGETFFVDVDRLLVGTKVPNDRRFPTIGDAFRSCKSGRGDNVLIMPGTYAETFDASGIDYLYVAGMYTGYGRPDIIPAAGLAMGPGTCQGLKLRRLRFANDGVINGDVARHEGNGFDFQDLVFDGDAGMANTRALLRLWCNASEDNYTASEGLMDHVYMRGSPGFGMVLDCQNAAVGVLPTDNHFRDIRFADNVKEDLFLAATAVSVADQKRNVWERCMFGIGTGKNKATHIDLQTNAIGADAGGLFADVFINDDTINTTAVKIVGTGMSGCGGYSLDGVINWDALD